ncbi:MAG: hypothetical protein M0Q38_17010 [Bacteroidales bacterium]|jgi:uncharacterized membrane protein|nr:hypothetical protein [Bacteroidales bacterium]
MKYKSVSCLIILLITLTFINGCKKDNQNNTDPKIKYPGNYSFTTIFQNTGSPDTTILYDGYISYDDFQKRWTVQFLSNYSIYPAIDNNGVMSYPESVNPPSVWFFSGNIDDYGNINFILRQTISHHGVDYITSYTVTGKKKSRN